MYLLLDGLDGLGEGREIGDGLQWLGGLGQGPVHWRNRFAGRAHREMVGPEARRVREGRIRFPAWAQSRIGSSRSGPCLNALGVKRGHLLEAIEGLRGAIVCQEGLALHEPWFRVISS